MLPYFQFLARWATLQAVVSPGPNPLPAAVCMKNDQKHGKVFYFVDQGEWYNDPIQKAVYADTVQEAVRTVI